MMMATTTMTKPTTTNPPPVLDLAPGRNQRSRAPQLILGLLVIAVSALVSVWLFAAATEADSVLAIRSGVSRGDVIELDDLMVVDIATDDPIATVGKLEAEVIVGRVAVTDMAAGSLVTADQFTDADLVGVGEGVVGLELDAGLLPSLRVLPGTTVSVVLTPKGGSAEALIGGGISEVTEVLVDRALVIEASPVGTQGRQFVALLMGEADASLVAGAGAAGRVALVQVGGEEGQ